MTARDESSESSPSKATTESATANPPEQSAQEPASAGGQSSGADPERPAASSTEASLSEDNGGGQDREAETASLESPPGATVGAEGESSPGEERAPLFTDEEAERFRERWAEVQAGFVDQPRQMVKQADDLVSDLMQQLTAGFSQRRSKLEEQWSEGDQVSTEDLRVALTRYRSFFNRLLSA